MPTGAVPPGLNTIAYHVDHVSGVSETICHPDRESDRIVHCPICCSKGYTLSPLRYIYTPGHGHIFFTLVGIDISFRPVQPENTFSAISVTGYFFPFSSVTIGGIQMDDAVLSSPTGYRCRSVLSIYPLPESVFQNALEIFVSISASFLLPGLALRDFTLVL